MRQDERYGRMSRDARELFNGLITMADDEGRLRAMPSAVLGFVFPYDDDAPRKLDKWMREVVASGMVVAYRHEDVPYLAFRHWARHQRIDKPSPSDLPPPPDPQVVADNSPNGRRTVPENSRNDPGTVAELSPNVPAASRARPDRIGSRTDKTPPSPPASGGGRQRDRLRFEQEMLSWAAEHHPDLPADVVAGAVQRIRAANGAPTPERVREMAQRIRPELVA
jgi:hypothetical protein